MSGGGKTVSESERERLAQEEARKVELRRQRELARFARGRSGMLRVGGLDEGLSGGTLLGGGQRVTAGP